MIYKRILGLTLVVIASLFLTGCMEHIEDTNGEDTALVTFTIQEKLDAGSFSSRGSSSTTICSGGTTYSMMYEEIDCNYMYVSYGLFSGMEKIQATDATDGETIEFIITPLLTSGNLEVVLVDPEDQIIATFPVNQTTTYTVDNATDGLYFIIVGGESTAYTIEIDRSFE